MRLGPQVSSGSAPGGSLLLDYPVGKGDTFVSPFFDFFSKSGSSIFGAGLNLGLKRPAGNGSVYFGGGGGYGRIKSEGRVAGSVYSASRTQPVFNVFAGLEYNATERMGFFVQGKYIAFFQGGQTPGQVPGQGPDEESDAVADLAVKAIAIQAGISFRLGSVVEDY